VLFNSPEFLLVFLPVTVAGYWLLRGFGVDRVALGWLAAMSLVFYGWWNPAYLWLLLGSIAANYGLGIAIGRAATPTARRSVTALGIGLNLALIGYFKYANFFLDTLDRVLGTRWQIPAIVLPLAISFFTFQQIAYLVDVARGQAPPYRPLDYLLFVVFFPQLIAGPIVHHREVVPQFDPKTDRGFQPDSLVATASIAPHPIALGLTIFTIGLAKKIWIADPLAAIATPLFDAARDGQTLTAIEAWSAALFYSFQLYFDFSGYSDMAIGAARLFGIVLPFNFDSPYKATNISDFWRRWHITLSNFLRDYLYIPLGGNRSGNPFINVGITMLLGGLWHGAGWTFVVWGGLHGLYLGVHRAWRSVWRSEWRSGWGPIWESVEQRRSAIAPAVELLGRGVGWAMTFLAVAIGWVVFRADRLETAGEILRSAIGGGVPLGEANATHAAIAIGLFAIVFVLPNSLEFAHRDRPALDLRDCHHDIPDGLTWKPTAAIGTILGIVIFLALQTLLLAPESEFLYFQF